MVSFCPMCLETRLRLSHKPIQTDFTDTYVMEELTEHVLSMSHLCHPKGKKIKIAPKFKKIRSVEIPGSVTLGKPIQCISSPTLHLLHIKI